MCFLLDILSPQPAQPCEGGRILRTGPGLGVWKLAVLSEVARDRRGLHLTSSSLMLQNLVKGLAKEHVITTQEHQCGIA